MFIFLFQKLAKILYEAADDAGYINHWRVEPILGYTQEQANTEVTAVAPSAPDIVQSDKSIYSARPSGGYNYPLFTYSAGGFNCLSKSLNNFSIYFQFLIN